MHDTESVIKQPEQVNTSNRSQILEMITCIDYASLEIVGNNDENDLSKKNSQGRCEITKNIIRESMKSKKKVAVSNIQ